MAPGSQVSSHGHPLPADFADALARVRGRLGRIGSIVHFYPTVESTNDIAVDLASSADSEGTVIVADAQTRGRGRAGRPWFSPRGRGLYVSVVLTPARARVDRSRATRLITLAAGVALAEAIERVTTARVDLKWPNDLYIAGRKLAGILAEAVTSEGRIDSVVLGYGINIGSMAYPPDLRDRATSLEAELGTRVDRPLLLAETLAALSQRYDDLLDGRFDVILDAWRDRAPTSHGTHVTWTAPSGPLSGVTEGIDDRGALLVRIGDRLEEIVGGEVIWLDR